MSNENNPRFESINKTIQIAYNPNSPLRGMGHTNLSNSDIKSRVKNFKKVNRMKIDCDRCQEILNSDLKK